MHTPRLYFLEQTYKTFDERVVHWRTLSHSKNKKIIIAKLVAAQLTSKLGEEFRITRSRPRKAKQNPRRSVIWQRGK